jgi:pimeloyl-ACP methyl ester carboxylesterase
MVRAFEAMAHDRGFFIVTTSRAGYGLSSRRAGRTAADVVSDVHVVLDMYGRGNCVALGWSGGGPHALACAALDRPRCTGVVTLAGVAPSTDDFDWTDGMGPENVEEFAVAREGGQAHEDLIELQRDFLVAATADTLVEMLGGLLSEADKVTLKDREALETMTVAFQHGLDLGYYGFLDDDRIFVGDWGFSLSDVDGPVDVWFGDQDLMVPPSHGRYLASHINGATSVHRSGEGHISIVTNFQAQLFDRLAALSAT